MGSNAGDDARKSRRTYARHRQHSQLLLESALKSDALQLLESAISNIELLYSKGRIYIR